MHNIQTNRRVPAVPAALISNWMGSSMEGSGFRSGGRDGLSGRSREDQGRRRRGQMPEIGAAEIVGARALKIKVQLHPVTDQPLVGMGHDAFAFFQRLAPRKFESL